MKSLLFVLFAMLLIPAVSYSQVTDSVSTISVITTNEVPYVYQNSQGYTVVVGEVENRNSLTAMSGIVVSVTFFDEFGNILDSVQGTTILDIVPPNSISPYVVTSKVAGSSVALASVDVSAFNSSPTKETGLDLETVDISYGEELEFSGTIQNTANIASSETLIHLAFYDVFDPPRLLHVETLEIGDILVGEQKEFKFSGIPNQKAVGFKILAESTLLQSDFVNVNLPSQQIITRLVTISNLSIIDSDGKNLSSMPVGTTVEIGSNLQFQTTADDRIQPYVYYVQIKQSGQTPFVEFLGSSSGNFYGTPSEYASVSWTPQKPGLYFVETFGWDQNHVPIASKGPVAIILVN